MNNYQEIYSDQDVPNRGELDVGRTQGTDR